MKTFRFGLWRDAAKGLFQLHFSLILAGLCSAAFLFAPASARAIVVVQNLADSGLGSLRDQIASQTPPGDGIVNFAANLSGQTILLTNGPIIINNSVTINIDASALANGIIISGKGTNRIFQVNSNVNVTLNSLTLTNGTAQSSSGGAIVNLGTLAVNNCTLTANAGGSGGAISNNGVCTIQNSTFVGNNATAGNGGAIVNGSATSSNVVCTLQNSTFYGNNSTTSGGGAIANANARLNLLQCTVSSNSTGIGNSLGQVYVTNTVIAGNTSGDITNSSGKTLTLGGSNIVQVLGNAGTVVGSNTILAVNPLLGPLANNGGRTLTRLPQSGSPAINAAVSSAAAGLSTDQRGFSRLSGSAADIGAVEFQFPSGVTTLAASSVTTNGATMNGVLNPSDVPTTVYFEYGLTTNYGSVTAGTSIGGGGSTTQFSSPVTSLDSATLYNFRAVATNSAGLMYGTNLTFTTKTNFAVTNVVSNTNDSGQGSLRKAIISTFSGGTVLFAPNLSGQTIALTSGEIVLNQMSITIDASALTNGVSIDGNHASRIFNISGGLSVVVLNSLTLTNAYGSNTYGGAISTSAAANLTLNNCRLVNNGCSSGAGALSVTSGSLTMNATAVSGNTSAYDSAISVLDANATIRDCTFSGNGYPGQQGSTLHYAGHFAAYRLSVANSTFNGNVNSDGSVTHVEAPGYGSQCLFSIVNSTFTANVSSNGSVIYANASHPDATITGAVTNCTVVSNIVIQASQPGAVSAHLQPGGTGSATLVLYNSIVSGNTSGGTANDIGGNVAPTPDSAFNLIGAGIGFTDGVNGNKAGINNPLVAALGNYGGPTQTMPPLPGSPAINSGGPVGLATDQRGLPRLFGSAVDIGAVESQIIEVTTAADSGPGSLRAAVASIPSGGTITFATNLSGQTITLTSGSVVLSNSVTIDASMPTNGIALNGNANSRIFQINSNVNVVLNALTLTNGNAQSSSGGAIANLGNLAINNCTLAGNTGAAGGAISNNVVCTVQNSTFYGNSATAGNGGALANATGGTLNLLHCTVSGNSAVGNGGGIGNSQGLVNVTNTIIAGNTGGDITNASGGTLTLGGSNIVQVLGTAGTVVGNNTIFAVNPLLGPLANNGGRTLTMLPQSGSPAINAGANAAAVSLAVDQRGFPRLAGSAVDIGAAELQTPSVITLSASGIFIAGATLNGTVNPNGAATTAYFRYGLTTNYGSFTATNTLPATNVTLVLANVVSGLTQNTTYYYQLVGSNSAGTAFGAQMTFTTSTPQAPTVITLPAGISTVTDATLNGTVNPHELATVAYFQYGDTTNYGGFTGTNSLPVTNATLSLSSLISGLVPGTLYHFRLVASNALGTVVGLDQVFGAAHTFSGAELGQGLDLQGSFLYAVNVGDNGAPGLIGDANFTADSIPGVTITTPGGTLNTINNFASPNFGATTNGLRLTQVMSSIRWTGAPAVFTVNMDGLQIGTSYQLQLLFIESGFDRVFNVIVNGTTIVPNFRLLNYGPSGTPIVIPWVFTATSTNALIQLSGGVGGTDHNPTMCGFTLETLTNAVSVVTLPASGVSATNATLNGAVNPDGAAASIYFRYGLTTNYGSFTGTSILSATNVTLLVSNVITGLAPGTTYYYQLVGSNSVGTVFGTQSSFTTDTVPPPTVTTLPASNSTATNATLNGTVNPNNLPTIAYFQYGLTTNYGSFTGTNSQPATNATLSVSNVITGLVPNAVYHFRLVANNGFSTVPGLDQVVGGIPPHSFTGAGPGQGLDLQGSFLYAVNVGDNGAPGLIGDANFTADNVPGVTITTPGSGINTINNWANPDFGPTTDGLRLTQVMNSIRWTTAPALFTVKLSDLQVGATYQLQLLFIESCCDRSFNVVVNGTTILPNFRLLDYGPNGTPIVIPYVFIAASEDALIQLGGSTIGGDHSPTLSGFTLEAVLPNPSLTNVVTTIADSGPGSLRDVVANASSGGTVTFATNLSGQTITLTSSPIVLSNSVTIDASMLTTGVSLNGSGNSRIFQISSNVNVVLKTLSLTNGNAQSSSGGAIANLGNLAIKNCTLVANAGAAGGAISNNAVCTVQNSTFYGNSATAGNGGAIANATSATLNLLHCTVSGNSAVGNGGGIDNSLGQVNVTNTVVAGNIGGDINNGSGSTLTFGGSNIVQVLGNAGSVVGINTILTVNPVLGPLANNGGRTLTMMPQGGSPAINAGVSSAAASLSKDQRGFSRLFGSAVDVGAVEVRLLSVATLAASGVATNAATLNGTITPGELPTTVYFEYGLTTNYGSVVAGANVDSGISVVPFSAPVSSLTPMTPYHFRAVATNSAGLAYGADITFNTLIMYSLTNTVLNTNDTGEGSLRYAVIKTSSGGFVNFAPNLSGQTILLTSGQITLNSLTMDASTLANGIVINGNTNSRIFDVNRNVNVVLNSLTLTNGNDNDDNTAGAIYSDGTLTLNNCTLAGNASGYCGAILSDRQLTLNGCTLFANTGVYVGALENDGTCTLQNCTFYGNRATNGYYGAAGAIANYGILNILHGTFSGNNSDGGTNVSGTIYNDYEVNQTNTIVAANSGRDIYNDQGSTFTFGGTNIVQVLESDTNGVVLGTNTLLTVNPLLGPLTNNGGPTLTLLPQSGSPAIDAGDSAAAANLSTDQRGLLRLFGNGVDIGAVEVQLPVVTSPIIIQPIKLGNGTFRFSFTNATGASFRIFAATNVAQPTTNWSLLGPAIESPNGSGQFQFTDPQATNYTQRFYRVTSP